MSTFQTLLAVVVLIFVLSVIVQAVQEVVKSLAKTKAKTMAQTVEKFMGQHLTLQQVQGALQTRGLDITALEHFNKQDFKHLLDGITLAVPQMQGIVAKADATAEDVKNNIAGSYDAARASFQREYTTKNKIFAVIISFVVVLALNANVILLYEELAADQGMAQAVVSKAATLVDSSKSADSSGNDFGVAYQQSRTTIGNAIAKFPPIVRDSAYRNDFSDRPVSAAIGLILMALLVSLGAPFWNDILKSMMGINNALTTGGKQTSPAS